MENVAELRPAASVSTLPRYTFETVLVTPEMADTWLVGMREQRRLRKGNIAKLVRIIETGKWLTMPHGIVFSVNGRLLDGQHRLRAIVTTGKAQWVLVARGCPAEYYGMIDDAVSPKNSEDVLKIAECPGGLLSYVGRSVRMMWRADHGYSPFNEAHGLSNEEIVATYRANRETLDEGALLASRVRDLCDSPGTLAYVVTLALRVDADATRRFMDGLHTGAGLEAGDPALFLRNTWMEYRMKVTKDGRRFSLHPSDTAIQAVLAINHYLRGKKLRSWGKHADLFGTGKLPPVGR